LLNFSFYRLNLPSSLLQPIYATVDAVADFAEQFTRLEAENAQLRKSVKTSDDQVLEAKRFASDAKNENASLKRELSKLKQQMKDEQEARQAAAIAVDKKEGVLRESVKDLFGKTHDIPLLSWCFFIDY
jgi:chromosome segregation ATPase